MSLSDEQIVEKVLEESKKLSDILNNHFLEEYTKLHNIGSKYNRMELKQELVAKKGYFLSVKKKYVHRIVNKEGVPVDEYDIRGLITRRSDYPSLTKEKIREIFPMLVKDEVFSPKKIRAFIEKTREELLELCIAGDPVIARPVSFTKPLDDYKRIPSHVHGMLLWNKLEYEEFFPGTRGKQFKILGINRMKAPERIKKKMHLVESLNNNIVIPDDLDVLPDYYDIDIRTAMELCWDNRVTELLDAIWGSLYKDLDSEEKQFEF